MGRDYSLRLDNILGEFASYLACKRRLSEKTLLAYTTDIKIIAQTDTFRDYQELKEVITKRINSIDEWDKSSLNTMHRRTATLNTFLKFLKKTGKIEDALNFKLPKIEKKSLATLSQEEFLKITNVIPSDKYTDARDKAVFCLVYYNGLKPLEIANLKYADFRREDKKINYVDVTNKERKVRRLEINEETAAALDLYERSYNNETKNTPLLKEGTYFKNKFRNINYEKMSDRSFRRKFKKYTKKAGIKANLRTLRNSYAQEQIAKGTDKKELAYSMGVSKIRVEQIEELLLKT